MSLIEAFAEGFLHIPNVPNQNGLVLTHGAGSNCQAPLLVSVAKAFADGGFHVLRCDLLFRRRRKSGPPHPSQAAEDRNVLRTAAAALRSRVQGHIFLGGHSYGGRQASILASEDSSVAKGLLLLSYPLHPPERPEQLRTTHFPELRIRSLFIHGTKDPFATPDELRAVMQLIPAPTELSIVDGAGHDLKSGKFDMAGKILSPWLKMGLI
jgi:predicted alpha/beta-hydrolase family hydrolase